MTFINAFKDVIIENHKIWFFDNVLQALCCLDTNLGEVETVSLYEAKESFFAMWIYSSKDKFYFVSHSSSAILVFDRKEFSFTLINNNLGVACEHIYAFLSENAIWFVPLYATGKLCRFELETMQFVYQSNKLEQELLNTKNPSEIAIVFPTIKGECLYTSVRSEKIVKYDFKRDVLEELFCGENLGSVCNTKEGLWYTKNNEGNIYLKNDNNIIEITTGEKEGFSFLREFDKYMIALPRYGNNVVFIDKLNLNCKTYKMFDDKDDNITASRILNCTENEHYWFFVANVERKIFRVSKMTGDVSVQVMQCKDLLRTIWEKKRNENTFFVERESGDLETFCSLVEQESIQRTGRKTSIGSDVFEAI